MEFEREIALKDGARCLLRSAREADAEAVIEHFLRAHAETDFLLSDPDESGFDAAQERRFLERKRAS